MLNAYNPPIAVALGCVAPKLSPHEAERVTEGSLPHGEMRGLGFGDIVNASARATAANGLHFRRKTRPGLIGR
ncbi:MAG: hypothetical protein WBG17_01610 [Burkholderiaceae bacterium]